MDEDKIKLALVRLTDIATGLQDQLVELTKIVKEQDKRIKELESKSE